MKSFLQVIPNIDSTAVNNPETIRKLELAQPYFEENSGTLKASLVSPLVQKEKKFSELAGALNQDSVPIALHAVAQKDLDTRNIITGKITELNTFKSQLQSQQAASQATTPSEVYKRVQPILEDVIKSVNELLQLISEQAAAIKKSAPSTPAAPASPPANPPTSSPPKASDLPGPSLDPLEQPPRQLTAVEENRYKELIDGFEKGETGNEPALSDGVKNLLATSPSFKRALIDLDAAKRHDENAVVAIFDGKDFNGDDPTVARSVVARVAENLYDFKPNSGEQRQEFLERARLRGDGTQALLEEKVRQEVQSNTSSDIGYRWGTDANKADLTNIYQQYSKGQIDLNSALDKAGSIALTFSNPNGTTWLQGDTSVYDDQKR